jgi:hypothetical protein
MSANESACLCLRSLSLQRAFRGWSGAKVQSQGQLVGIGYTIHRHCHQQDESLLFVAHAPFFDHQQQGCSFGTVHQASDYLLVTSRMIPQGSFSVSSCLQRRIIPVLSAACWSNHNANNQAGCIDCNVRTVAAQHLKSAPTLNSPAQRCCTGRP